MDEATENLQLEFLLNLTVPLQIAFRSCHKMNPIVERACHYGFLLGKR